MTEYEQGETSSIDETAGERLRAIAAELSTAGLVVQLHRTKAGLDLTATLQHAGRREMDVIVDEDGYTELRYWADQAATPAQIAHAIATALAAVAACLARQVDRGHEQAAQRPASTSPRHTPRQANEPITGYDGAVTERAGDGGMAKPSDIPTEDRVSPDSVTSRSPDQVHPDIARRLENLDRSHPSSPYNADGTRKPPVPNPFAGDYPIPGDPDYEPGTPGTPEADQHPAAPGAPDRELPTEDKPVTGPDGSWKWRGQELKPECVHIADQAIEMRRRTEGRDEYGKYGEYGLTPSMHRIDTQLKNGHLADKTEEYALKGPDRFKEKLAKMISDEPDADPRELASRIIDGIRYTFQFPDEVYGAGVLEVCDALTAAGFEMYERKNAWADETKSYKGINSTWVDGSSEVLFEVQMHTSASWKAKQESHDQYEIIESLSTTAEEKKAARDRQDEIFAGVPIPDGAINIPSYRKEGW